MSKLIMSYFDKLQQKVNKYKLLYSNKHKKAAIKLIWWNFCKLFEFKLGSQFNKSRKTQYRLDRISFFVTGGIGDILISFNYCSYLLAFLKDEIKCIDIFVQNQFLVQELIGDSCFNVYPVTEWNQDESIYLLDFRIDRFPFIVNNHLSLIDANSNPKTRELVKLYEEFYQLNKKIVYQPPQIDSLSIQYSIINRQNRMQQPDIYGYLNISGDNYKFVPSIFNDKEVLKAFGLHEGKFITLNRGVDGTNPHCESTKLYPLDYYNSLVKLIKSEFKEYKIVQLGVSADRCQFIDDVDLNLVGKTSLNQLKAILKNSFLHIDGEGGMVHLRKSLNGSVSVVIFGPTSSNFYGYSNNVNISSNACPVSCEWINDNWASYCINKQNNHTCMKSIKPILIFEEIKKILK
ncbi:hypothetical protein A9G24_10355 [Gilliamella sp. App6-5]|uniref:glycosyltransferase family 9 protein n=1 Tax=Gilliamella sp. App6-5 TaxID=3120232 RepID=UPI00080E73B0|nr:glycosyltransferase family 9 protein [Gilliamella apicola]OCG10409.1 hypothetical protein A9G24_10355 [Gilliamella apicola]